MTWGRYYRTLNGRSYRVALQGHKKEAAAWAEKIRLYGFSARVLKREPNWAVYTSPAMSRADLIKIFGDGGPKGSLG